MRITTKIIAAIVAMGLLTTGASAKDLLSGITLKSDSKEVIKTADYEAALQTVTSSIETANVNAKKLVKISSQYNATTQVPVLKGIRKDANEIIRSVNQIIASTDNTNPAIVSQVNKNTGYLGLSTRPNYNLTVADIKAAEANVAELRAKGMKNANAFRKIAVQTENGREYFSYVKGYLKEKSNKKERFYLVLEKNLDGTTNFGLIRNENGDTSAKLLWEPGVYKNIVGKLDYYNVDPSEIKRIVGYATYRAYIKRMAAKYSALAK